MEHYKLFPTNLFVYDEFYKQDVGDMKKYISDLWNKRDYDNNWQTKSADLQKQTEFTGFAKDIITTNKTVISKVMKYYAEDIVITDMWANVLKPGEMHPPHTHSNNFLSGVWYLESDGSAGIFFKDPRGEADVFVPRKSVANTDNSSIVSFASMTNRAIIFPSWFQHWVPINHSKKNRISISWNIQIKGQLGEHHEFQSASF
jgi:uncharacterized protein (TIGR02466 family)